MSQSQSILDRLSEKIFGHPLARAAERELAAETLERRQRWAAEFIAADAALTELVRDSSQSGRLG